MPEARGDFDVTLTPATEDEGASGVQRLLIAKSFTGDLTGISAGQMLSVTTPMEGSAAYVALETVTGTLGGRTGTFSLRHSGLMDRGDPFLSVDVVPDSATDELEGLRGTMSIEIDADGHHYRFEHTL